MCLVYGLKRCFNESSKQMPRIRGLLAHEGIVFNIQQNTKLNEAMMVTAVNITNPHIPGYSLIK